MKSESEWKTDYAKRLRSAGHYAKRVEDKFGVGFPDMVVGIDGMPMAFIEVKLMRSNTYFAPDPRQYIELMQLHRPPFSFGVLLGVDQDRHIFHFHLPAKKALVADCFSALDPVVGTKMFIYETFRSSK